MKLNLLILATISLLTACQTAPPIQPPGNEINALLLHEEWQLVATQHPQFAAFLVREFYKMDYEHACTKARLMGALKEKKTRTRLPQIPPAPTAPKSPPAP